MTPGRIAARLLHPLAWHRMDLRGRLMWLAMLPVLVFAVVWGSYVIRQRDADLAAQLQQRAQLLARQLAVAADYGIFSFNQAAPAYPDGWEGVVEYCRLKGVSLQAWSPLARGLLSGGDLSDVGPAVVKTAALVQQLAEAYSVSSEAIVLAWLMRHPAGIMPVLGTSRCDRLRACAESVNVTLSRDEWYRLFEAARGAKMP